MFGADEAIAGLSQDASIWIVLVVAVLLGLRHATDPDHLVAVTALVAGGRERVARRAGALGVAWGVGHALTLLALGLPIILLGDYLPGRAQQAAETAVAILIVYLAVRLVYRWRKGLFHVHPHEHSGLEHAHLHGYAGTRAHGHEHAQRTPVCAFVIGLVHGVGGSAGVTVLLVASIESTHLAVVALALVAVFTVVSMWIASTGLGLTLFSRPVRTVFGGVAPTLGVGSLAFGIWYATAAWSLAPYPF